jgi:hypothetical protein
MERVIYCSIVGCGAIATDKHHIGGAGSPMVWVCHNCHGRVHGVEWHSGHSELTKQGIARARAEGRIGGNPGIRARDPEAISKATNVRRAKDYERLVKSSVTWLPVVEAMRPAATWGDVVLALGGTMTAARLRRSVKRLVSAGRADARLLDRAPVRDNKHCLTDLIKVLAETRTLQQIAYKLEEMGERTPRGGTRWHPSSVRNLLLKASPDRL